MSDHLHRDVVPARFGGNPTLIATTIQAVVQDFGDDGGDMGRFDIEVRTHASGQVVVTAQAPAPRASVERSGSARPLGAEEWDEILLDDGLETMLAAIHLQELTGSNGGRTDALGRDARQRSNAIRELLARRQARRDQS